VHAPFVELDVPGFRAATVAVPDAPVSPRAVIVALHGNFDRPEWQCQTWRPVTHGRYWIVCPRGIPRRDAPRSLDRWEWGSLAQTKAEILAALAALRRSFQDYVEPTEIVLIGFSLGAILGGRLLKDADLGIASAVLIEGGYTGFSRQDVRSMSRLGLRGVLFACGQAPCRNALRGVGPLFEREQIFVASVADLHAGHDYGALAGLIEARFHELEEAPRRSSVQPPLPFRSLRDAQ
jgi:pimeloyl-ACP methyl ester carboxylesterase